MEKQLALTPLPKVDARTGCDRVREIARQPKTWYAASQHMLTRPRVQVE